jgi:WD40 repeat protein
MQTVSFVDVEAFHSLSQLAQSLKKKMRTKEVLQIRREHLPVHIHGECETKNEDDSLSHILRFDTHHLITSSSSGVRMFDLSQRVPCLHKELYGGRLWEIVQISNDEIAGIVFNEGKIVIINVHKGHTTEMTLPIHSSDYGHNTILYLGSDLLAIGAIGDINAQEFENTSKGYIGIWNVRTWKRVQYYGGEHIANCICLMSNNRIAQGCRDTHTIIVYDRTTRKVLKSMQQNDELKGHINSIQEIDGYLFTGGQSHNIFMWDSTTYKKIRVFKGHTDWVRFISLIGPGMMLSTSDDGNVYIWDTNTGQQIHPANYQHSGWVFTATLMSETCLVTAGYNGTITVWK